MADPFVAEIRMFGFDFAPTGWAKCDGQLLPVSQNTALFSLLAVAYGGDGKNTFALPDLAGRVPLHAGVGNGPGLGEYARGDWGGADQVALLPSEMPAHTHTVNAFQGRGSNTQSPNADSTLASSQGNVVYGAATNLVDTHPATPAGSSLPHNNAMPSLVLNFCIALQGVFPPRP